MNLNDYRFQAIVCKCGKTMTICRTEYCFDKDWLKTVRKAKKKGCTIEMTNEVVLHECVCDGKL